MCKQPVILTMLHLHYIISQFEGDRLLAIQILEEENIPCPIYVDTMTDEVNMLYGSMPERLYIIENDIIAYAGSIGPWVYNVNEVEDWLKDYRQRSRQSKED